MTSTAALPLSSTKEQIVLAAERLFAARGYEGVSLREIGAAAGSGNNSAVQYHFGSKGQLVVAIFENRLPYIDDRRAVLIGATRTTRHPRLGRVLRPSAARTR